MLAQISIQAAVEVMFYLFIAVVIFAIIWGVIAFFERKFPGFAPFAVYLYAALVILAALVAIGFLLGLLGVPVFRR